MQFGAHILRYEVVGSTQDAARERALAGAPAGTVVAAEAMTAGRGRQGRAWHTPPGANVCLTAIGEPVPLPAAWQIALVGGVAACEAIREALGEGGPTARVRYPNDVLLGGKKVCGVLVETVAAPGRSAREVVPMIGIGINVKAPSEPLPPEIAAVATSLEGETGRPHDVRSVEAALLRRLSEEWRVWQAGGLTAVLARWKPLLDPDARRVFVVDGVPVACRVVDLAPDGTLSIELSGVGLRRSVPAAAALME
ncbi:MAG TPA: biotin--[acetyl-CoA-carboxylase] ligase [Armatimonadaceae bacterium]|nr:biotin--[acetyl-CoA-carboxylase] ligase [Armatimonadaceae bacterium]